MEQTATQYSAISITLHKVVDGNYPTHPTSSNEFENAITGGKIAGSSTKPQPSPTRKTSSLSKTKDKTGKKSTKLTLKEIIKMSKAGLSDEAIISNIDQRGLSILLLSSKDLDLLTNLGISKSVIKHVISYLIALITSLTDF